MKKDIQKMDILFFIQNVIAIEERKKQSVNQLADYVISLCFIRNDYFFTNYKI